MSLIRLSFLVTVAGELVSAFCGAQSVNIPKPASPPEIVAPTVTSPDSARTAVVEPTQPEERNTSPGYVLQPGDLLQIAVWKETELTSDVVIRPDGGLTFPLAGDMQAAGRTVAELTEILQKRIRKFEPDAVLTVGVKSAAGNRVYVVGKVAHPGDFPINRPTDVMQALSLAGGTTPFANTNGIRVLRRTDGKETSIRFRYTDVEHGSKLQQNILLQSGDTVVVP